MKKKARALLILIAIVCVDAEIEPDTKANNNLQTNEPPQTAMLPTYTNLTQKLDNANSTQIVAAKQTIKSQLNSAINLIEKLITELTEDNNIKRSKRSILSFERQDDSQFTLLWNEIDKIKTTIEYLTNNMEQCATCQETESRIEKMTRKQEHNLKTIIDNVHDSLYALTKKFDNFMNVYSDNFESDCADDIKNNNLEAANKKLTLIDNKYEIISVVVKAYNNKESNFDLLLQFGDNTENVEKKFEIYRALTYEMINNGHDNPLKNIKLAQRFRNFVSLENVSHEIKTESESFVHELINVVKLRAKDNLMYGLRNGYHNSTNTELEENIHNYDETLFADLIKNAMYETYGEANNDNALKYMSSFKHIRQLAEACIAIFETLERKDDLNSDFIVMLAYNIKTVMSMPDYDNLDDELRSDLELVKTKLPKSVMNAAFASRVCIKNVEYDEYIYSPESNYQFDDDRRYVIMWKPGDKISGVYWKIEKHDNDLYIKNLEYNEYMYSPLDLFSKDTEKRYVFTWMVGSRDPDAMWKIEPDGDYCYLKNVKQNEYMYAPIDSHDNQRRYVFTWRAGIRKDEDAKWEIEEC